MKTEHYKQIACISAESATEFETKSNAILAGVKDPEILFDQSKPYTAYIIYKVRKDIPETVLELLEMLDDDGGRATCADCPYLVRSKDKRKAWHTCSKKAEPTRADSRACEDYYMEKRKLHREIINEFMNIPYTVE